MHKIVAFITYIDNYYESLFNDSSMFVAYGVYGLKYYSTDFDENFRDYF